MFSNSPPLEGLGGDQIPLRNEGVARQDSYLETEVRSWKMEVY